MRDRAFKRCPQCAEDVLEEAKICRFCGHTFDETGSAPRNRSAAVASRAASSHGSTSIVPTSPWWKRHPGVVVFAAIAVALAIYLAVKPGRSLHGAPNVQGLTLPVAKARLRAKGFTADVHTTALFGVIVEQHFYVCGEGPVNGKLVVLDAEKSC